MRSRKLDGAVELSENVLGWVEVGGEGSSMALVCHEVGPALVGRGSLEDVH